MHIDDHLTKWFQPKHKKTWFQPKQPNQTMISTKATKLNHDFNQSNTITDVMRMSVETQINCHKNDHEFSFHEHKSSITHYKLKISNCQKLLRNLGIESWAGLWGWSISQWANICDTISNFQGTLYEGLQAVRSGGETNITPSPLTKRNGTVRLVLCKQKPINNLITWNSYKSIVQ